MEHFTGTWHSRPIVSSVRDAVKAACRNALSAHTRPVAVESLGLEIVEIILKAPLRVDAEVVQKGPGIDAGRVQIVEAEPDRIIADSVDREDGDVALAAHGLALRLGMPLHFGGWAGHPQ